MILTYNSYLYKSESGKQKKELLCHGGQEVPNIKTELQTELELC